MGSGERDFIRPMDGKTRLYRYLLRKWQFRRDRPPDKHITSLVQPSRLGQYRLSGENRLHVRGLETRSQMEAAQATQQA